MKNVFPILLLLLITIENISASKSFKKKKIYIKKNLKSVKAKQKNIKNFKSKFYRLEEVHKNNDDFNPDLQIKKFHNFERLNAEKKIIFNMFVYFFERKIVKNINLKIEIIYNNEINNQNNKISEESVQCTCTIGDNYKDKIGFKAIKESINYKCEGSTSLNLNIAKVTLDKNHPLLAGNEQISFDEINH